MGCIHWLAPRRRNGCLASRWNAEKNEALASERGVSFEGIVVAIESGGLLDIPVHPNQSKYPKQRVLVVARQNACLVPFVEEEDCFFLKTVIPSRKADHERLFPGIGPKSSEMLRAAGITTLAQLQEIGAVRAFVMVKRAKCKPSLNFLWGLESVITGEHWRDVARNHRASLLLALEDAEKNG